MQRILGMATLCVLALAGWRPAAAVPFDLIYTSDVTLGYSSEFGHDTAGIAWLVAKDEEITAAHLAGASFTGAFDSAAISNLATSVVGATALAPHTARGGASDQSLPLFSALLAPGEAHVGVFTPVFQLSFTVDPVPDPADFEAIFNGTVIIDGFSRSFSTIYRFVFDPQGDFTSHVNAAARVAPLTAVPEPAALGLLGLGLAALALGRRRLRQKGGAA